MKYKERARKSSTCSNVSCKRTDKQITLDDSFVKMFSNKRSHPHLKHRKTSSSTKTNNDKSVNGGSHSSLESVTGTMVDTIDNSRHGNSRHGSRSDDAIRIDDDEEFDKLCSCIDLTVYR